ncbi:hypothetical protein BLOT_007330 [Blomia tropicalis]|nr:hypothetical protein BLOT_007330 [Blomia tropicalis]
MESTLTITINSESHTTLTCSSVQTGNGQCSNAQVAPEVGFEAAIGLTLEYAIQRVLEDEKRCCK